MKIYTILGGRLYQSGRPRDTKKQTRLALLQQRGIDVCLALWGNKDIELSKQMFLYRLVNLPDGKIPEEMGMLCLALVSEMAGLILQNHRVLVYCYGGRNRSGLISALIVRELKGFTGREALEWVRSCRPHSVVNKHFEQFLLGLPAAKKI